MWSRILNVNTFATIALIIAVVYCLIIGRKGKYKYQGTGMDGLDIKGAVQLWQKSSKPKKKKNKHEEKCRDIFEKIYGKSFKSVRPDWLKNPVTKRNLELDGFCESIRTPMGMGLAFEYDGEQHAKYNRHFHRSGPNEFLYQVKKDSYKDQRCREEGVLLIRIPHYVAYADLERYIRNKLTKLRILPANSIKAETPWNQYKYTQKAMGDLLGSFNVSRIRS